MVDIRSQNINRSFRLDVLYLRDHIHARRTRAIAPAQRPYYGVAPDPAGLDKHNYPHIQETQGEKVENRGVMPPNRETGCFPIFRIRQRAKRKL